MNALEKGASVSMASASVSGAVTRATAYQIGSTRHFTSRAPYARSPLPPSTTAVMTMPATEGPASIAR